LCAIDLCAAEADFEAGVAVPLERQALRNLPDADMIRTILSNVKIQGAGSSQSGKGGAKGRQKRH